MSIASSGPPAKAVALATAGRFSLGMIILLYFRVLFGYYSVMRQKINAPVSVMMDFNHYQNKMKPVQIQWNNRDYKIEEVGLHHHFFKGKKLFHVFSVASRGIFFKLVLDTENLFWKLEEVADGLSE